jgi:hypothetical protein
LWCFVAMVAISRGAVAQSVPSGAQPEPRPTADGQRAEPDEQSASSARFPWLLVPLVSSNPKLGTAGGGLGAYVHEFDKKSKLSMFGAAFVYTSTDSKVGALFARTSFGEDHHRIDAVGVFGHVKNDYEDYLGTGEPLKTNDDAVAVAGRYRYRVKGDWFVGAQGAAVNYQILGESALDDGMLDTLGVQGFKSVGLGASVSYDSRDNQDMPTKGWFANLNNLAYREWLGSEDAFDVYRLDVRLFARHGRGHVFAVRQNNEFTAGAPVSGQATVLLRGYKPAEYLGRYMSSLELEERFHLWKRIGATAFTGVASIYGESTIAQDSDSLYPVYGTGLQFVLMPARHLLVNLEYAYGNENNSGTYLKLGYAW